MISVGPLLVLSLAIAEPLEECKLDEEAPPDVATIQWQISLHSGLSRLGASGSVRARTRGVPLLASESLELELLLLLMG